MRRIAFVCLFSLMGGSPLGADQNVVLLGGGYQLEGSQGQIELNLKWVQDILEKRQKSINVYYTDGDGENPDVFLQTPIEDSVEKLQPLARVFGQHVLNEISYRNHTVEGVLSETTASVLQPALKNLFEQSKPDDSLLVVYNGHGAPSALGAEQVALKLWGDTRMTAEQFHGLLSETDPNTDFRYIFTQCYSGGFHRLIYEDPVRGHALADGQRCGFTAESSWRQSEGCSASIDMGDYRDYTTFFFAAINGEDRLGQSLLVDPDQNSDGVTDMREAHLYTLEHAHSTDLSRSSSEDYLEQWRPWFLKWLPMGDATPENEYAVLSRSVALRIELDDSDIVRSARQKGDDFREKHASLSRDKYDSRVEIQRLSVMLTDTLTAKWPQLKAPYTRAYKKLLTEQLNDVQSWILAQASFEALRLLQDKEPDIEKQLLALERDTAQTDKVLRFRRLAFLQDWLYQYGSEREVKDYEGLVSCESSPI